MEFKCHIWQKERCPRTAHALVEDEVEELDEHILVFVEEDVGDARVHLLQQPRLQLLRLVLSLGHEDNGVHASLD